MGTIGKCVGFNWYLREVTKEEFDAFLAAYSNPLEVNVTGIVEPPMRGYYDFSLGKGPLALVASVSLADDVAERKYRIAA